MVTDKDTAYWENVLTIALCDYDDKEKADQGFGLLDIGWTNPTSTRIAWWIHEYGAPAISAAIARQEEAEEQLETWMGIPSKTFTIGTHSE